MIERTDCTAGARVCLLLALAFMALPAGCGRDDASGGETADAIGGGHADEEAGSGEMSAEGRVVLGEAAYGNAGIEVAEARTDTVAGGTAVIEAPGRIAFDPASVALVSPRATGRIERLDVVEGVSVREGQPVAWILSPAFLTAQNEYILAARRAAGLAGTADESGARAVEAAARRRLQLLGANDTLLARLAREGTPLDWLPVLAPFDGSIIEQHAMTGAAVEPGSPLYTIADLSHVDVLANVPENSIEALHRGQNAVVRVPSYPSLRLEGRVERIRLVLDTATRTVEAVIRVPNAGRRLRPGMFATVSLHPAGDAARVPVLTVPESAVLVDGADRIVFVEVGERTFERRIVDVLPLAIGPQQPGLAAIREGLVQGERVVVRGAFFLKSELAKASFGEHDD